MQDSPDTRTESSDQQERIVDSLRRVTADLRRARRRIGELESRDSEPLAIVGMACRLPGGIDSPESLWDLLDSGGDAVSTFPLDRGWDLDALTGTGVGASATHHGGFLGDAAGFDAAFFGISPREAAAMDPQQRQLMEVSWEALERAGIDPTSLRGSPAGVFVGSYHWGAGAADGAVELGGHALTGTASSVLSGRLAYTLGLEGPAVTVDTACSSSLVALHLAAHALRSGEASLAVVGGVTVMSEASAFVEFTAQGGLSADGRCKAFAGAADGTGWAEGVGVLVVERLSDAQAAGHPVLAVVRGSAVNSDGASNGLTAPHGPSQERVIGAALERAGLTPSDVDAVEAHGTGTTLGDPIEAQAILATYGSGRDADHPLYLGSLKSNIGHTQAAAGVAGVIKTVLALRHATLPRTLHVDEPTPHVDWSPGTVQLLTEPTPWPDTGRPRRAAVSSFGISGTNAHAILEQAPDAPPAPEPTGDMSCGPAVTPWLLSGRTAAALRDQAAALDAHLGSDRARDVGLSLLTTRARFDHRAVVVAAPGADPRDGVRAVAVDEASPVVARGVADVEGRTVFVFPGQGSQWVGMGARLLDESPVFAARVAECADALAEFVDWSLLDVLRDADGAPSLERVDVVQPASFTVMVGLAAVWRAHGVSPDAVVGHSQGEIAAAVVAGALSLADGARVVALRSQAIARSLAGRGGMMSVALPVPDVEAHLERYDGRVSVAAVNGPRAVVVSGDPDALDELGAALDADGVRVKRIAVNYASHSHHVEDLRAEVLETLSAVAPRAGDVPLYSTVTGDRLDTSTMDATYWYENLRGRVRFADAIGVLAGAEHRAFVEVSPHPVLAMAVQDVLDTAAVTGVAGGTLRRDHGGYDRFLLSAAELLVRGVDVDLAAAFEGTGASVVDLPTYAFQHDRYWATATATAPAPAAGAVDAEFWAAVERADVPALTAALGTDEASVAAILPGLSAWRRGRDDRAGVDAWRYRVAWTATAQPSRATLIGTWLLVCANDSDGIDVTDALTTAGADVHRLTLDDARTDRAVLRERLPGGAVSGVVSVLAAAEDPDPDHPGLTRGLALTVALVQALGDAGVDAPCWLLTRGAVAAAPGDTVAHPLQAQVAALGWTAAVEHPQRWGGTVDLPDELDDRSGQRLAAVLAGRLGPEDQLAVRGGGVLARRIVRGTGGPARSWMPRGTTVVTGGSGTLAPGLARWLAGRGAEHVVLLSRRGPDAPGTAELVAELAAHGTEVSAEACDVTDRDAVAALLQRLAGEGRTVGTVVHTAAVIELSDLDTTTVEGFARVVHAKVTGARILDELVDDPDTDLVLYSSTAGMWGSGAHAAYAAGNAYLSALAEQRRTRGLRATSVHWGKWPDTDLERAEADPHRIRRTGLEYLDPDRAMTALQCVLDDDETVVGLMDIDWDTYHDVFTAGRPSRLFDDVPEVRDRRGAVPASGDLAGRLQTMGDDERERFLLSLVRTEAAAALGHTSADAFDTHRAFRDAGFDSVTAVDLRNRLTAAAGVALPSTAVFDHPDPAALAAEIGRIALGTAADAPHAPAATVDPGEPIAVVGMACRYPGGVAAPEDLLRLALDGVDAITGFPADRGWDAAALHDPDPDRAGHTYSVQGGFLHDAAAFDPGFFGISPREALAMDPQQRILLETSWEAFERAGIDPESLRGSATGAFFGATYQDYSTTVANAADTAETHMVTGTAASVLSGRVAYLLGLEGPAVTVDTACSSSLVAMHLASQSLHRGESSLALAGGTAVMATPSAFVGFSRQRALAADGRCKPFSEAADGMTLAEGVGVLVLERLSDARANGHPVLAVIRGSAINSDGASNGLTAPNGPSQQRVIRAALADAGLEPSDVDVVEAHGTGTALGDPIEAQALLATYGRDRDPERPLRLGSVKSAIGHTQAAAGVAGVITMVTAMHAGELPGLQHLDAPTSHVDWSSGAVELLAARTPWEQNGHPRRAGVSSFGISGTNAHLLLEHVPAPDPEPAAGSSPGPVPWVVSARSAPALRAQARALLDAGIDGGIDAVDPARVGYALATTRSTFDHRAVVVGDETDDLVRGLRALAGGTSAAGLVTGTASADPAGPVFVFPGQGAQWWGMGRALLAGSAAFRESVDACAAALAPHVDWSLHDVLSGDGDAGLMERVDVVQPALFATMVGLAAVWRSYGVEPAAVVGHSQGEIAAACVAGALSLEDAARVVALRSKALPRLSGLGGMVSVTAPVERVTELIGPWGDAISVAAVNGPSSVVVSGDSDALDALLPACESEGVRAKRVSVDYASHGRHVEAVRDELADVLAPITPLVPRVAFYSTVTGERLDGADTDAAYWYTNLRHTVRMRDATRALLDAGHRVFVEVSPHPVLAGPVGETQEEADPDGERAAVVLGTLRRDDGGVARVLTALAEAHVHGARVRWTEAFGGTAAVDGTAALDGTPAPVALPTYAFQRTAFWPRPRVAAVAAGPASDSASDAAFWELVEGGDAGAFADALGLGGDGPLDALLPALSAWRAGSLARVRVDELRHRIDWTRVGDPPTRDPGRVLVVGSADPWVTDALGPDVVAFTPTGTDRTEWATELAALGPVEVVVSVQPAEEQADGVPAALHRTLLLVQALGDAGVTAPLWCLTRGAVATGPSDDADPEQATLWGLGRVAALEHPDRWGGLIDLPSEPDARSADRLRTLLSGGHGEDQLAIRPQGVLARRLVHATPGAPGPRPPRRWRGTVLVTGGTGGIGGRVALRAAERGAEHLLLTSRRGADAPGAAELRAELEGFGARVTIAACDAADRDALADLLAAVGDDVPLRAVVHAAGVAHGDAPVADLTVEQLRDLLRAKLTAARHLDELTRDAELDAFVLFSSGAAVWGSGGQPGYAAANASLDALAAHRRARRLPASSVAWGTFGEVGMATDPDVHDRLHRQGVPAMEPESALAALDRMLDDGDATLTVSRMDWEVFAPNFTATRPSPLLAGVPEAVAALADEPADTTGTTDDGPPLRRRLEELPAAERARALVDAVRGEAAAVLGHDDVADVPAGRAFRDVGFDSATAVELRNRLRTALGLPLPAALVFDHPTPADLARHVGTLLFGDVADAPATADDPDARVREALASVPVGRLRKAGLLDMVLRLAGSEPDQADPATTGPATDSPAESLDDMDADALLRLVGESAN